MKRLFFITALLAIGSQAVSAADFSSVSPSGHTLYYNINDVTAHTLTVTYPAANWVGYTKPTGTLIIPDTVTYMGIDYFVTVIGEEAFEGCSGVTSVTLPNTLVIIEEEAFYDCHITNLTIPNSVKRIYSGAFTRSIGATMNNLYVPDGIEYIAYGAFPSSGNWISSQPAGIIYLGKIAYCYKGAFANNATLVFASDTRGISSIRNIIHPDYYYPERIVSVVLPDSLRYIDYYCFEGCSNLQSITFPDSLERIGMRSFYGCGSLTQVTIPSNVKIIETKAFSQCGNLSIVNYNAANASTSGHGSYTPFIGCENFTTLNIGNTVITIPSDMFAGCTHLSTINMSDSVVEIGTSAFANTAISTFTIPRNLNSIGNNIFTGCTSLRTIYYNAINCNPFPSYIHPFGGSNAANIVNIVFGNEVQNIPDYIFYQMTSLQGSINFPNSLRRIGNYSFYGCTGLTGALSLPINIEYVGSSAFSGCTGLTGTLSLPTNVEYLGNSAFSGCTGLSGSLILPNSLQYIGSYAFNGCTGFMGSLNIPNNTVYIGGYSFAGCNGITSITIGQNVDTMSSAFANMANLYSVAYNAIDCSYATNAFSGNTNVTNFTIGNTVRRIPEMTIYGLPSITTISIPEGLTHIGQYNFSSMAITGDVILPSTLAEIGYGAFTGCYGIDRVICNAINPPIATSVYGQSLIFSGCTTKPLLVPCESINAYRNTPGWNNFTNISGIGNCGFTISALSGTPSGGYVEGGGVYNEGEQCTLSAIAYNGYRFDHWDDNSTQNPRTFTVSTDATYIAYFVSTQSIEDIDNSGIIVFAKGYQILIDKAIDKEITIYTIDGRTIASLQKATEHVTIPVTTTGVYFVRIGDHPARKVVVIR